VADRARRTRSASPSDPLDDFVALADEARATAIAAEARSVSERLDAARLRVFVIAMPHAHTAFVDRVSNDPSLRVHASEGPAVSLFGRGIRLVIGMPGTRWPAGRADLVIVDDARCPEPRHIESTRDALTYGADLRDRNAVAKTLELVDRMALEVGADRIEKQIIEHYRHLCRLLWQHLAELDRAFGAAIHDTLGRINTLVIARILAEQVFETYAEEPDTDRQAWLKWLTTERTKFLMATKADALVKLDERIAQMTTPRNQLWRDAPAAAHEIAVELLATFWQRLRAESDQRLFAVSRRVLDALDRSLGDLVATLPFDGLARVVGIRGYRRDTAMRFSPGAFTAIAARMGLAGRRKLELAARDELVARLETESLRLTTRVLTDYAERTTVIEERVFELLDSSIASIQHAAELASATQEAGADAVARARADIAAWSVRLADVIAALK
jgi:hypothetical protein